MKNKKLVYILLPLVLLIWGTIFYQILFSNSQENELPEEIVNIPKKHDASLASDTFSIIADYRDPFLQNQSFSQNTVNEIQKSNIPLSLKVEKVVQWPTIVYGGTIMNQKSSKQLALVKINGKEKILKTGEMVEEIELVKIYKDSIEVRMLKNRKVVKK